MRAFSVAGTHWRSRAEEVRIGRSNPFAHSTQRHGPSITVSELVPGRDVADASAGELESLDTEVMRYPPRWLTALVELHCHENASHEEHADYEPVVEAHAGSRLAGGRSGVMVALRVVTPLVDARLCSFNSSIAR